MFACCKFKRLGWEFLLSPGWKSLPLAWHLFLRPFWAGGFLRIVFRTLSFGNHYNFLEMVVFGTLLYDPLCLKVELLLDLIGNVFNKMGAQKIGRQHNPFWKYRKRNWHDKGWFFKQSNQKVSPTDKPCRAQSILFIDFNCSLDRRWLSFALTSSPWDENFAICLWWSAEAF